MNPLTAGMGARFLQPPSICAVCGREVDPDEATVIASSDEPHVSVAIHGLDALADVTPSEQLVICKDCSAKQ